MHQVTITARLLHAKTTCVKCGRKAVLGERWIRNDGKKYRYYICPECYEKMFVNGVSVMALCDEKVMVCDQRKR